LISIEYKGELFSRHFDTPKMFSVGVVLNERANDGVFEAWQPSLAEGRPFFS
jgi:hypothetical protein